MAAPKGNKYALGNNGGRPPHYKTVEELQSAINDYFEGAPDKPTVTGLAYFLGFESRHSIYDYKKNGNQSIISAINRIRKAVPFRKLGIKYKSHKQYMLEKYHKDPLTNLRVRIDASIRQKLKSNTKGKFTHLPYSVNELRNSLECKFKKGMTWDNMSDWHIDHIIPVSLFNFTSVNDMEFKQCYSLDNLQPLWAKDNIKKSNTLGYNQISIGL